MCRTAAAALLLLLYAALGSGTRVQLVNNGYTGLVVGIDDQVDILQCQDIVRNLQVSRVE